MRGVELSSGQVLDAKKIVIGAEYVLPALRSLSLFPEAPNTSFVARCICITDSSLVPGESTILVTFPPKCMLVWRPYSYFMCR